MADAERGILTARRAFRSRDWRGAERAFLVADAHDLSTADLRDLAACRWWLSDVDGCLATLEDAFRSARAEGDDGACAETALLIALLRMTRGELTVGTAWVNRARRLLQDQTDGLLHAYLAYLEAAGGVDGDTDDLWPAAAVDRLEALSEALASPAVEALAAVVAGMRAIRIGDAAAGFDRLDDAMLAVVGGDLPPEWAGDVLCMTIHACSEMADYRRMAEWTRATERWCAGYGADAVYVGVCRVHRLELQSATGQWDETERELERTCTALRAADPWVAGEGWYQVGEIRRLRGDVAGARVAYAHARECGIDPAPGEVLLHLTEGDGERAWALLSAALTGRDRLARARLLRAAIEVALGTGRAAEAPGLVDELEADARDFRTDGFRAWAAHGRGMVALADGDVDVAIADFHRSLDLFRRLGLKWEQANLRSWIAAALERAGNEVAAAQMRTEAADIFDRLGARPVRVGAATRRRPRRGPITDRESEILELVAQGASNRDIAQRLFISEKTVGRHLANVYVKLGVGSRTAAAAWWRDAERAAHRG